MSEYTPTTSAVRSAYTRPWEPLQESVAIRNAEFDRWLAAYTAEVRAQVADEIEGMARSIDEAQRTANGGALPIILDYILTGYRHCITIARTRKDT